VRDDVRVDASEDRRHRAAASLRAAYITGSIATDTLTIAVDGTLRPRRRWDVRSLAEAVSAWWKGRRPATPPLVHVGPPPDGPGPWIIGRSSGCRLVLSHDTVSGRHAELRRREDGDLEIVDLGSLNGTWVNGWRVDRAVLHDGDVLHLADVRLVI
jgi:FHA domain